jgi:hypothetical protein
MARNVFTVDEFVFKHWFLGFWHLKNAPFGASCLGVD